MGAERPPRGTRRHTRPPPSDTGPSARGRGTPSYLERSRSSYRMRRGTASGWQARPVRPTHRRPRRRRQLPDRPGSPARLPACVGPTSPPGNGRVRSTRRLLPPARPPDRADRASPTPPTGGAAQADWVAWLIPCSRANSSIDGTDVILKSETAMSSLHEIQTAIGGLSPDERQTLLDWLLDADRQAWDRQIAEDFAPSGAGAQRLPDIDEQIRLGKFRPLE